MRGLLFAFLIPLAGCFFGLANRQPVWSVTPESIDLVDYGGRLPFVIPEKHLIVCTTQSRHLVAYDAATGNLRWSSKEYVDHINGFDASTITFSSNGTTVVDTSTGATLEQVPVDKTRDVTTVVLGGVAYGVTGSRELFSVKDGKVLWSDRPGFIPNAGVLPEMYHGFLVFRGTTAHVAIGFIRVYEAASGKLLWDLESEAETSGGELLKAQLAGDRAVVLREGVVTSRELASGRVIWSASSDEAPMVTATRVVVFDKNVVKVLDAVTGKSIGAWPRTEGNGGSNSTAADGVLYVSHSEGVETLGGMKYNYALYALDEKSGRVQWRSAMDKRTVYAAPMVLDDKVVIVSTDKIYAMKR